MDIKSFFQSSSDAASDDLPVRRLGLVVVIATFGVFGLWAAVAPLSSAALSSGVVTVESYRKTVQHMEGGITKAILVRDGEAVVKDQVLLVLEDTQPRSQLEVLRGQYYIDAAREARLVAQGEEARQVTYPVELLEQQADTRVQEAMRVQNQTFNVRKTALDNEVSVYRRQIEQLKVKVQGLKGQKQSRDRLVMSYQGELSDFESLLKEGYTEKQKVRELERNLSQNKGQQSELVSEIAATELQIAETELKILQLKKELQREVAKELAEVQSQLFELKEKIQSLEDTVRRTVLKAPDAGIVLGLSVHNLGAVIPPGGHILDIVPQNEKLIVEAQISPMDIDRVRVGQLAEVRFSAFKARQTLKIEGRLIGVSADRLMDDSPDKMPYYLGRIAVTQEGLNDLAKQHLELVPGMPTEVLIHTGERTLLQYLLQPLIDTFARSFIED